MKFTKDELLEKLKGELGEHFNEVLDGIKTQQDALSKAQDELRAQTTEHMVRLGEKSNRRDDPAASEKGLLVGQIVRAVANGGGNMDKSVSWAKGVHGDDSLCVKALMASDLDNGGVFVTPEFSQDLIELLTAGSVVRSLNPTTVPLNSGTITLPKLTGGATSTYLGESQNITSTAITTGQLTLTAKKLASIVPISNDLLRFNSIAADRVVRDDLVRSMSERMDLALIRGDGFSNTPKGLRNWCVAANVMVSTGTATPSLAQIDNSLSNIILQLRNADVRMIRPGWLMAPRTERVIRDSMDGNGNLIYRAEMQAGNLRGYPYRVTTQIPITLGGGADTEIYLADFADCVLGEAEGITIDASDQAAYHDGSNVQAAFSRDETVIRAISLHDFGMRHDESIALSADISWTTASSS